MINKNILIGLSAILISAIVILAAGSTPARNISAQPPASNTELEKYADQIIADCADSNYRPACYDKEIPKIMDYISMEDAFAVTVLIQNKDSGYPYCHVLGHELSAREIQKDPADWKDVVSRCPSGVCSNGCIHGGFQERFRAESFDDAGIAALKPDLMDLCEKRENWNPTGLEQGSCYHALGHLTMYLTDANLNKSIEICNEVALKPDRDYTQICYDGVFMQIFQPLEPEDFALVEGKQPTKDQIPEFCLPYSNKERASCLSESWPLFYNEIRTPKGVTDFCGMTEETERPRCYDAVFFVVTAQMNFDIDEINDYCSSLPSEINGKCFANGAARMIETDYRNIDKSISLCNIAKESNADKTCFEEMLKYSTFNFHAGSEEFFKLCNAMPNEWKNECLAKNQ